MNTLVKHIIDGWSMLVPRYKQPLLSLLDIVSMAEVT